MAVTISEIQNLTTSDVLSNEDIAKFNNATAYAATIEAKDVTSTWKASDNIQVTWSNGNKVVTRAVNGTIAVADGKCTISGLVDVSKYSVGLNGQIGIGPKTNPEAVLVSVRIGNIPTANNPKADWIIDFSDKQESAPGTSIKLNELVEWIQGKSNDTTAVSFPPVKAGEKEIKDYTIEFKDFYYNATQNTFDFNVQSKDGDTIQFGNFSIKKAGFRVTNTPQTVATKAIEKA